MKLLKLVALFTLFSLNLISYTCLAASIQRSQRTEEAYVTLLYGDEFLLGVRVLGKSIRDTGSTKDIVVLVSDGVSDYAKKLLLVIFLYLFFYICLVSEKIQLWKWDFDELIK